MCQPLYGSNQSHDLVVRTGDEMVGTLNGQSLTGRHPLITSEKHSVMFVMGGEGSVRHFRVWEALPNPDWTRNKAAILAAGQQGAGKK